MKNDFFDRVSKNNEYLVALGEFEKELKISSDRGIALICGSIIDQQLSILLKSFLIKSETIDKDLFKGNGTLADFDSKIKMSFYLGLISKSEMSNITYLQRIRNKFAHQISNISFENNDIKNMCSNFEIPKNCYTPKHIPFLDKETGELPRVDLNPIKKDTSAKDRFIFTFRYLFLTLGNRSMVEPIEKREEFNQVITPYASKTKMNQIMEETLDKYKSLIDKKHTILEERSKSLDELKKINGVNNKDKLAELEKNITELKKEIDKNEEEYEDVEKTLRPMIEVNKYVAKVIKNSMID
ncbi:MltR family transcriptional regulator [Peribacillus frigoritolerans]|uniref:MltR family transcriptional regulator n=1 Tax=Peribacillus frigoritolerans TaxID=450367 RepID=UPI0022271771|nr:MltR family transcriptional regulator [Peribacillus frigoritolerans]UYY98644.1 MltR family transcriptional regulator [Peribacillus frigoritolerans]